MAGDPDLWGFCGPPRAYLWTPRLSAVWVRVRSPRARSRPTWLGRWWLRRSSGTIRPVNGLSSPEQPFAPICRTTAACRAATRPRACPALLHRSGGDSGNPLNAAARQDSGRLAAGRGRACADIGEADPHHPAAGVAADSSARRQRVHHQQAAAILAQRVLNDPRAVRCAAVEDRHPDHLRRPRHLDGEAALAADGVADRVRAQLDRNARFRAQPVWRRIPPGVARPR